MKKKLAALWGEILNMPSPDPDRSFLDLGGTSLLANKLVARIQKELGVSIPVIRVFEFPTLNQFLDFASKLEAVEVVSAAAAGPAGPALSAATSNDIAIIGMACRFPGAKSIDEFWRNLIGNKESIRALSKEELSPDVPEEMKNDPRYVRAAGLIDEPYKMDAAFFDINPMEAKLIDPQQRVLLETAWEALENSGYAPGAFKGRGGVFAGIEDNSYYREEIIPYPDAEKRAGRFPVMTGNEKDYVAMRIAHKLDMRGPAVSVHTACSTSLVAVIMACKSLRLKECDLALAGGASVHFPTPEGYYYQEGGVFSSDGHCKPFDSGAQGTVFTDGSGIVVLKRLEDALRDNDSIVAVIKGGAINNDGGKRASFSSPSILGQSTCIAEALKDAGVDPSTLTHVEAHGTATPVGDPIEMEGLRQAFGSGLKKKQFCGLGSVKSNIGHTTAAAGVASLIKMALALKHELVPATLHYRSPNPGLDIENSPFYVVGENTAWPKNGVPRRAGVSSFGIGGTNSHLILQEAPARPAPVTSAVVENPMPFEIFPVAAKTDTARDRLLQSMAEQKAPARDIAFTLQNGRAQFKSRGAVIRFANADLPDLTVKGLTKALASPRLAFMFPGQGSQYIEMGKSLYKTFPVFRETFEKCAEVLSRELGLDFCSFIFDSANKETLENTRYTQPALFAIEVSLGRLFLSWGIKPEFMLGHSVGEFAAAHLAGVFSLEDGLKLISARGRLMASLPRGRMLSVRAPIDSVKAAISGEAGVDIASINSPLHSVLAGENAVIDELQKKLEAQGMVCRPLHTSHAFHSAMMDPVVEPFLEIAKTVKFSAPQFKIISTVTCQELTAEVATDPRYWAGHLRATVKFSPGLGELIKQGANLFIEVGPRTTLSSLATQHLKGVEGIAFSTLGDSADEAAELGGLATALAKLWASGLAVDWNSLWSGGKRIALPTYPFERKEFRFSEGRVKAHAVHALAAAQVANVAEPEAPAATASTEELLLADLGKLFSEHSGLTIEQLDSTFVENGFDSLVLMQIGVELGKRYGVSVSLRELMEKVNTLKVLTKHIEAKANPAKLPKAAAPASRRAQTAPSATPAMPMLTLPQNYAPMNADLAQVIQQQLRQMKEILDMQIRMIDLAQQGQKPVAVASDPAPAPVIVKAQSLEAKSVPTSAAQREIFSASLSDPAASLGYNHSITIFFEGKADAQKIHESLIKLLERHEALRGRFSPDGMTFLIKDSGQIELPRLDLSELDAEARKTAYDSFVKKELDHLFDLVEGPLFRATLVIEGAEKTALVFNCHHAIVDGWSLKTILDDLPKIYSTLVLGDRATALEPSSSFSEYLVEAVKNETDLGPASRQFWRETFKDGVPVLDLPLDKPRPLFRTFESKREDYRVRRDVYDRLKKAGAQAGASQFVTLLSAFGLYLSRISGQKDPIVGVPVAGQIKSGKAKLLGHDARVLPLLCSVKEGDTFRTYATRVKEHFLSAYENQWVSMPDLIRDLKVAMDPSRVPFVSVMFNFDPGMKEEDFRFEGVKAHHFFNHRNAETFEISINAVVENDDLVLECAYNCALFDDARNHDRLAQFEHLMDSIARNIDLPVQSLALLPEAQLERMENVLNATTMEFERELCVDQLIAKTAQANMDRIAVEFGDQARTYAQVWEDSGKVAASILKAWKESGTDGGKLVGVMVERSEKLIGTLLGVWRAGAAFVPLDPAYPADRLQYMIDHSGLKLIIADASSSGKVTVPQGQELDIDTLLMLPKEQVLPRLERSAEDAAYVIYTSGSTGKPKGVKVPHRSLNNFLKTMETQSPGISRDDRVLAITTLSFDIAELELWLPLTVGARTVVVDRATAIDGQALIKLIDEKQISFMQATPATWRVLLFSEWQGKQGMTALCGGEALPKELAEALRPRVKKLWNVYGPTETTVWSTIDEVRSGLVTIGKPIGNTQVYILDENRMRVPAGCVGELWIGGDGVALGYLHASELTQERFIVNPFSGKGLMYKTGDLVRLRLDGRIEYVGRNDFQVKVRGFRIELGEVQHALAQNSGVGECVVVVRDKSPGDSHLVAFYTKRDKAGPALQVEALKSAMRSRVPEYMIPGYFVELDKLPLTQNGKVNQKELPNPFALATAQSDSPLQALELELAKHPAVKSVRLLGTDHSGRPILYYIPQNPGDLLTVVQMRKFLKGQFEERILPQKLIAVDALQAEVPTATEQAQMSALSEREKYLADIWKQFLGVKTIRPTDNFFNLGGHSLLSIQMIARVQKETGYRLNPKTVLLNNLDVLSKHLPAKGLLT